MHAPFFTYAAVKLAKLLNALLPSSDHFVKYSKTYRYIQYINIYIYIYIFGVGKIQNKVNACFIFKLLILIPYCLLSDEEAAVLVHKMRV